MLLDGQKRSEPQKDNWSDAFVYFKHEESGIGPKLATQLRELFGEAVA